MKCWNPIATHTHTHNGGHIFGTVVPGQARSGPPRELLTPSHLHNLKPQSFNTPPTANTDNRSVYTQWRAFALPGYDIIPDGWEAELRFPAVDPLFTPSINYMFKKLKVNKQTAGKKDNWPLQKSIRTDGRGVIHLLVQHNYLFFFRSFTSLFSRDVCVPANQRKALFVIIQIKHGLLGGKRLSDYNATTPACAKNKLPWSQMWEFYYMAAYIWKCSIWLPNQLINKEIK